MKRILAALVVMFMVTASFLFIADSASAVNCIGDGKSGKRVQMMYASVQSLGSDYGAAQPVIVNTADIMNQQVLKSAQKMGGDRRIRFATDPFCNITVATVTIPDSVYSPASAFDKYYAIKQYLQGLGYNLPSRKYIVFLDDPNNFCGLTSSSLDDNPDPALNRSNNETNIAIVGKSCWPITANNRSTALHELVHMLGAVNDSAPHAMNSHCYEAYDLMCFVGTQVNGIPILNNCPVEQYGLLDCNNDDYFSTNPPAGSYLATHWNIANSGWLNIGIIDLQTSPTPSPSPTKKCKGKGCR